MPSKVHGLNSRQYRFCLNILQGMSQTDAYINAGYNCTREDAWSNASTLMALPKVNKFIEDYQAKSLAKLEELVLSPVERKQILSEIARSEYQVIEETERSKSHKVTKVKRKDPIMAIAELNKMDGSYAPSKHLVAQRVQFEVRLIERGKRGDEE